MLYFLRVERRRCLRELGMGLPLHHSKRGGRGGVMQSQRTRAVPGTQARHEGPTAWGVCNYFSPAPHITTSIPFSRPQGWSPGVTVQYGFHTHPPPSPGPQQVLTPGDGQVLQAVDARAA